MSKPKPVFIVAEISKKWSMGQSLSPLSISQQFEQVIDWNSQRGYRLLTFQLNRLMTGINAMNETIIAVFERELK